MANSQILFSLIENLRLEKDTTFELFGWTITNNKELILKNIPNHHALITLSGTIFTNLLFEKTIAFKIYDFKDKVIRNNFVHAESGTLNALLSLIWLYRENSIFTSVQISQDCKEYHTQINRRNDFTSNSSGKYEEIHFTSDIINNIKESKLYSFIEPLIFTKDIEYKDDSDKANYHPNAHRADLENSMTKFTRIQRAFLILNIARTTSFLPMKIAFYINVLECLLLNDNMELNFKLQMYTANFIGKDKDDKMYIRNTINKAYGIRSVFFHGSKIKQNQIQLEQISKQLDNVLRKTIIKAIETKEVFNDKNTSLLNDYLKSILFQ